LKPSVGRSKALIDADHWLYWSLSLVQYSRNDSTISFDYGALLWFLNEIVPHLTGFRSFGAVDGPFQPFNQCGSIDAASLAFIGGAQRAKFEYLRCFILNVDTFIFWS